MLDDLDSAILKELQSNARQSFRELAEKFETSAVIVAERVRKMEEQGIIEGYSAILNHEKLECFRGSSKRRNRIATSNTDVDNLGNYKGNDIHNDHIFFLDYSLLLS